MNATETTPNCKNPTPDLSSMTVYDRHRYDDLAQYLQTLIPLLEEMGLIETILRASVITSLVRSHKSRFHGQSYRASDLVERLSEFDQLVVSGYEIRTWTVPDINTGRSVAYIQFLQNQKYMNGGKTNDNQLICFKKWTPAKIDPELERRRSERFLDKIEQKQREVFEKLRLGRKRKELEEADNYGQEQESEPSIQDPINDIYLEDTELHEYLRSMMQKSRCSNLKDKTDTTIGDVKKGI
jgi:hypothetical protein